VAEGDYVAFGGFPGQWRNVLDFDALEFASFSSGATRVTSVGKLSFIYEFAREFWVKSFHYKGMEDSFAEFGGLNGGPAFILRQLHWDFVGIIHQYSPDSDALYFRHAGLIRSDGQVIL
jgi:hypothetical protein